MEFLAEAEKQLEKSLKELRFVRGGEYLETQFKDYLLENEILSQLTTLGTSKQNDFTER